MRYNRLIALAACIIALAAIAFIYFYPDAAQGNTLRQHDTLQGIAIGQEAKAFHEQTGETTRWTNSIFSGMPTFQIAPSYESSGWYEWINKVYGLWLPAPANLVFMMMAGFFILLMAMKMRWYVSLMGAVAYGLSSYFIIIIGAGHIWKFVTLAYIPPTLAGLVLCYRGRYLLGASLAALFAMMQIAANHVQMTYYFLFVVAGFVLVYLIEAIRSRREGREAMRRWTIATACLVAAAGLAAVANLPSLYNTYEYSKETMRGRHSELSQGSGTAASGTGLDRDYITQYSYGQAETFTLLIPNIKGGATMRPEKGNNTFMSLADLPEASKMQAEGEIGELESQYLQYLSQYFGEPEGTNGPVYAGAIICALFILGLIVVKGPWKWVLLALTLFSIFLAWGRNFMWFTDLMIDYMPMYSKFRTVESILVIAEFTMPLLGAMALQKIFSTPKEERNRYFRPVCWAVGIPAALCILAIAAPGLYGDVVTSGDMQTDQYITRSLEAQGYSGAQAMAFSLQNPRIYEAVEQLRQSMVRSDALRSLIFVIVGGAILMLNVVGRLRSSIAGIGLAALVLCDLYSVNKRYLSHDSFVPKTLYAGDPIPMTDTDRAILADTTSHYRVMDIPNFWQAAPSYHHRTIGGYHAAKLTRYQDLIDRHLSAFLSGEPTAADWQVLDMLNARYVVMPDGPRLNDRALGNAWLVDTLVTVKGADQEMAALSAIDVSRTAVADEQYAPLLGAVKPKTPGDTVRLTSYAPNRLTYHASTAKGGTAVFSEVFFPWGWKATVDGQPASIARVDYLLRAIALPAGEHKVEMWFDPDSLHTTNTLAIIAIILIYAATLGGIGLSVLRLKR